jgi:hypothetical protein
MNFIVQKDLTTEAEQSFLPAETQQKTGNDALARLMKAWESRNAKNAKRVAGFGLMAVTLTACGGSSDDGDETPTTPVEPTADDQQFFVLEFPTQETNSQELLVNGGTISIEDALAAFAELNDVQLVDDGDVTIENINIVQDVVGDAAQNDVTIGDLDGGQDLTFAEFLALLQDQNVIEVGRVILTPEVNSGVVYVPGTNPGDQFSGDDFGTFGTPSNGDDTIFMGRTELLHAAILDGGDGNDTLVIEAKGSYAQPSAVVSIETVRVVNSQNTTADVLASVDGQNILNAAEVASKIVTTFPTFTVSPEDANSWIDLSAARDISTLVIGENTGVTDSNLAVIGVNNGAELVLQNGFDNDVLVSYGFNFGTSGIFKVRLEDVNFEAGNNLIVAQNSTHLRVESTGEGETVENYIADGDFGGNLRTLTVTGDKFLHIESAINFNTGRPVTIDASANTGGVKLTAVNADASDSIANNTLNVEGSQGDDTFTLEADAFNIEGGAGENTYELTGSYSTSAGDGVTGARVIVDGTFGTDTIVLQAVGSTGTFTLLAGSSITGGDNTIVALGDTDLSYATLSGIDAVVMNGTVTVTTEQAEDLGADVFSAYRENEADAVQDLHILVTSDTTLSDLLDLSALSDGVKLTFSIAEGATLTMSAEEMHEYLAVDAIDLGDGSNDTSAGTLVITDAGPNFDAFDAGFVDAPELPIDGGGTITGSTNNLVMQRSPEGYDRPTQQPEKDDFVIYSDDGPVEQGPNDFGDDEELTIPQTDVLMMTGANDIAFTAPVSFDGQTNFMIDFSEVGGTVSGLEIVDFNLITSGPQADWGQVIGNGDARIDVQLIGEVADASKGLSSSGVATYVVTDLNGGNHAFWTSDPTEDLEVLGLQGNAGQTITFGNVRNGVTFLMEGDGFASFDDVPKALEPLDESNIGTLVANFNAGSGTVNAVVNINNQGVELGAATDGGERELYVDGIVINSAQSITLNISDGDADIGGVSPTSGVAGVMGDILEDLTINSADDVVLTIDSTTSTLKSLDAGDVDGAMTLLVLDPAPVDLSGTVLTGIDAVEMNDGSDLTLTVGQALDIGMGNISVEDGATTGTAQLTLNVTSDFNIDELDVADLPEGLTLELSLQSEVELKITGGQLSDLLEAGVVITDGSGGDPAGTLNITDFTQANLQAADGSLVDSSSVLVDAANYSGTITTDGSDLFVPTGADAFLGEFAWKLETGTLGLTEPSMANGLVVENGNIEFYFITFGGEVVPESGTPGVNAENYTDIGTIFVTDLFVSSVLPGGFNVERIANLSSDTTVEIVPLEPIVFDGADRILVVGGLPFADNEAGIPVNLQPVDGTDPAPVVDPTRIITFSNVTGNPNKNVENVTINFEVGGNEINSIVIGGGGTGGTGAWTPGNGNGFDTLTIVSGGDDVNTVNNITATVLGTELNNLLNVDIIAEQDFVAQTITFSSVEAGATATLTITGTADVTLKAIDTTDAEITSVVVDTTGYSGTLTITGGSDSAEVGDTGTLVFVGDGNVVLDTNEDAGNNGVDGGSDGAASEKLTGIDAAGHAGSLTLGVIEDVSQTDFTLTGGTGVITGTLTGTLNADPLATDPAEPGWAIDLSNAAADSSVTLDGSALTLTKGGLSLQTGVGSSIIIEDTVDLRNLDVTFGADTQIELADGGLVLMTDDQFVAFEVAGGDITGETAQTFNDGIDLQDVRGLTEINIEDEATGTVTLSSDQVAIARVVDATDPATDDPSDFGDIQALDDVGSFDLSIVVKEGATFEVTDNEIDGVAISGPGTVITTMEGTAGATLNIDTVADDDVPGQSITVNYTLNGVADSVVLENTATDFTDDAAVEAALVGTLSGVDGLTAKIVDGQIVVDTDEPGVDFTVDSVDVSGTTNMDIGTETFVESTADMSSNAVADTTHVFPTLEAPAFYTVTGTLGGDETVEIEGTNLIDLTDATIPTAPDDSINITGGADLIFDDIDLDGLVVTGEGTIQADVVGTQDPDLSGIDVPLTLNVADAGVEFNGDTQFNPGQPLTLVDAVEGGPNVAFDITLIVGANDEPVTNRPAEIILDNVDLTLTAAQADGLMVSGASEATVVLDPSSSNTNLSGIDVPLEVSATDPTDFGGNLPSGQPITFSGGNTISLNGNTIPAGSVISIAAGTTLDVTGGTLGAGVSFIMEGATSVLTITGAQADGTVIEGAPDPVTGDPQPIGTVDIVELDGTHDLTGVDGPTLQLTFADDAVTGSISAAAVDGRTINVAGGDTNEDFDLTITDLEDTLGADLSGLTLNLATGSETNVDIQLDSTGDVTIADTANFNIAGATSITLTVSGTGTVDVANVLPSAEGADLSSVDSFVVGADATLVADGSLSDPDSGIDPADVSGEGTLEITGFDAGDTQSGSDAGGDTADVDFVTFVFDGEADYDANGPVVITNFLGGNVDSRDQVDLSDILLVQSESNSANKANLEGTNGDALLILTSDLGANAASKIGMETEFGADIFGADDSTNLIVAVDSGNDDWYVWLWEDGVDADGDGTSVSSDGMVGESELTLISIIDSADTLTPDNFL